MDRLLPSLFSACLLLTLSPSAQAARPVTLSWKVPGGCPALVSEWKDALVGLRPVAPSDDEQWLGLIADPGASASVAPAKSSSLSFYSYNKAPGTSEYFTLDLSCTPLGAEAKGSSVKAVVVADLSGAQLDALTAELEKLLGVRRP